MFYRSITQARRQAEAADSSLVRDPLTQSAAADWCDPRKLSGE